MTDLIDEVRASFEQSRDEHNDGDQPLAIVSDDHELVPGLLAVRQLYDEQTTVMLRRGYRHYAGASLPSNSDELVRVTGEQMMDVLIKLCLNVFTDGVLVGHRDDHLVRMCLHFDQMENLFRNNEFRATSQQMASGFANDSEIHRFFTEYVQGAVNYMSHVTGFAHTEVESTEKVWDIWNLSSTATVAASYLAGHRLGSTWAERDVLSGIEIATKEGARGPDGQAEPDL